jgi:hypothetical protein
VLKGEEGEEKEEEGWGKGERRDARGVVMGDSGGVERGEWEDVLMVSCAGRSKWDAVDADASPPDAESTWYESAVPGERESQHCGGEQGEDVLSSAAAQCE